MEAVGYGRLGYDTQILERFKGMFAEIVVIDSPILSFQGK